MNGPLDLEGVLVIDKPPGLTSFAVVKKIRQAARIRKVGHTGTLDPMATGVLPLVLGRATKLAPFFQAGEKEYQGRMLLGLGTDTDDVTGQVIYKRTGLDLDPEEVVSAAGEFVGNIEQVAPAYSAVKFCGRPAYKLARAGEKVPAKARWVKVHEMLVTEVKPPRISFYVRVSKGTYIRSLAADLGRRLGTGACLESLRRLSSNPFTLKDALGLEEALELARTDDLAARVIPLDQALSFWPQVRVSEKMVPLVQNGQPLRLSDFDDYRPRLGPVRVKGPDQGLLAVYEYKPPSRTAETLYLTPLRVLGKNQTLMFRKEEC